MVKEGWKKIGVVGVDSGQLMIVDPCYIDNDWKKEEYNEKKNAKENFSYNAVCKKNNDGVRQINYEAGHKGLAVSFCSGFGDGVYEVYALFKKFDKMDMRIVEVRIKMI